MALSAFFSYSHKDKKLAQAIATALIDEGIKIWIDEGELRVGDSILERITAAISDIDFVVALISQNSVTSNWCKYELTQAMTGEIAAAGVRVLPLRVGDVPLPQALTDKLHLDIDAAKPAEAARRLASDIRLHEAEKPGMLSAALAGLTPDQGAKILRRPTMEDPATVAAALLNLDLDWSASVLTHLSDWNCPEVAAVLVEMDEDTSAALLAKIQGLNPTAHYVLVRMAESQRRAITAAADASLSIFSDPEDADNPGDAEDPEAEDPEAEDPEADS